MNFIVWLIAGAVVGWVASNIMRTNRRQGLVADVVVGIVGGLMSRPAGVKEQGIGTRGFPRNMGGPVVSPGISRPCGGPSNVPRPAVASHPAAAGANQGCTAGTAKRRKRSAAGRATGSRSALIVPSKSGQAGAPADPAEGSGASGDGTVGRKRDGGVELRESRPRRANG